MLQWASLKSGLTIYNFWGFATTGAELKFGPYETGARRYGPD